MPSKHYRNCLERLWTIALDGLSLATTSRYPTGSLLLTSWPALSQFAISPYPLACNSRWPIVHPLRIWVALIPTTSFSIYWFAKERFDTREEFPGIGRSKADPPNNAVTISGRSRRKPPTVQTSDALL